MKYLLAALLMAAWIPAHATNFGNPKQNSGSNSSSDSSAIALSGAVAGDSSATNGNVSNDYRDRLQIPATPSAIAPSVGNNIICQIATPKSKAFSALIVSTSYTDGVEYNDVCYLWHRGEFELADKLMCHKSKDFAAINPVCKQED